MLILVKAMLRDDAGATMVEYGLMIGFVALVALTAVKLLGTNLSTLFNNAATSL